MNLFKEKPQDPATVTKLPPIQMPALPRRVPEPQMSESYARAIQEFDQLKSTLHDAMSERDQLKIDLAVEVRENDRLRREIEELQEKLNVYRTRVNEIEARFDDASAIILRVIDSRLTEPRKTPSPSIERLEDELEPQPQPDVTPDEKFR